MCAQSHQQRERKICVVHAAEGRCPAALPADATPAPQRPARCQPQLRRLTLGAWRAPGDAAVSAATAACAMAARCAASRHVGAPRGDAAAARGRQRGRLPARRAPRAGRGADGQGRGARGAARGRRRRPRRQRAAAALAGCGLALWQGAVWGGRGAGWARRVPSAPLSLCLCAWYRRLARAPRLTPCALRPLAARSPSRTWQRVPPRAHGADGAGRLRRICAVEPWTRLAVAWAQASTSRTWRPRRGSRWSASAGGWAAASAGACPRSCRPLPRCARSAAADMSNAPPAGGLSTAAGLC